MIEDFEFNDDQREQIYNILDEVWDDNIDFDTAIDRIENIIRGLPPASTEDLDEYEDDDVDD